MTTLEEKFESFESQVATQHTALTTALTATNTKLDTLISLFGGAPPTPTATLDDVITAIGATNVILDDMHADTISMDQKLLRIRDAINPLDEALPVEAKSSMPWLLYRIMDAINPTWPRPTSTPAQPALSLLLALSQLQLPNLATIHTALGTPTGDATTTALGLLASIQYSNTGIYASTGTTTGAPRTILDLLESGAGDCPCASPNAIPTGCASPYRSTTMAVLPWSLIPGYSSLMFARFGDDLPSGLEYGTTFGITEDTTELYSDEWEGWQVYVSSDLSQFSYSPTSFERLPTNTWLPMPSGAGNYAWSVDARGGLTVTLCAPTEATMVCNEYTLAAQSDTLALQWHATPTTVQIVSPSGGAVGLYFWKFSDESTYINRNLSGTADVAEYLDQGHINMQSGTVGGPVTIRVCSPSPGAVPYLS